MRVTEGADQSSTAPGLAVMSPRRPGRRVVVLVAALAVAALVAAVLLGLRWWRHPDLLAASANSGSLSMRPLPLAHSQLTFTVIHPAEDDEGPRTVTFSSPPSMTFKTNSARATATFNICYQRAGKATNVVIGSVRGTGGRYCARLVPVEAGTSLQLPSADAYIIATLTPHRPGRVVVTGVDFSYALGADRWWSRRGVEHVDTRVVLHRVDGLQARQS